MTKRSHVKELTMRALTSDSAVRSVPKRFPPVLLFAVVLALVGGTTFALIRAFAETPRAHSGGQPILGPLDPPTLDHPLSPEASRVSLTKAASVLGTSVVLPDSPTVKLSDAGPVWAVSMQGSEGESSAVVAVTFPAQGLIVDYSRPAVPASDPLSHYQLVVKDTPGSQVVYLNGGVPAIAITELPDASNWGSIGFQSGGTNIVVLGHTDDATLQGIAQSILDRISKG